jgi:hypothetical protein
MVLLLSLFVLDVTHAPGHIRIPKQLVVRKGGIEGYGDVAEGLKAARRANLPVMMVFWAACEPWRALERGALSDSDVIHVSRRFVVIFVDTNRDKAAVQTYKIRAVPKVLFLKPDGTVEMEFMGTGATHHYLDAMLRVLKILGR